MKRGMLIFVFCIMFIFVSKQNSMAAATRKITSISVTNVSNKKVTIEKGKTYQLKTKVTPTNATNKKLSYTTSDKRIATVSTSGKIKGVKNGKVTIKVSSNDGSKKSASIQVIVGKRVNKIQIINSGSQITEGKSCTIKTTVNPSNASIKTLKYSSSNTKAMTISSKGIMKAVKVPDGQNTVTVTITVQSTDGGNVKATKKFVIKKQVSKPTEDSTSDSKPSGKKAVIAHMGYTSKAPANSIPAFTMAALSGNFTGIETDVRQTKDGRFVLYHDEDLSSRTTGSGSVASKTYNEIAKYTLKKGNNIEDYSNLKIPTLEEYLVICKANDMQPVLHIKSISSSGYRGILDLIDSYGLSEEAVITGGKTVMANFRNIDRAINLAWICYMSIPGIDWAAKNNIDINSDYQYVTKDRVDYAKKKGLRVGAWTVNKKNTANDLWAKNVDFITSDYNIQ